MAERSPTIACEDVPVDEARRMSRGTRIEPELYYALKDNIRVLVNTATRMTLPESTSPTTMKNRIPRVAAEWMTPVTIRKVPGGLLFWGSPDDEMQQAQNVATRFQSARRPPQATPRGRLRRT
jgi:hypothetical protein